MELSSLTGYADLRRLVSPAAYTAVSTFLAWHNQQRRTAPLALPYAATVAMACDTKPIDRMLFGSIKAFLEQPGRELPDSIESCRVLAERLLHYLFPHDYHPDSQ